MGTTVIAQGGPCVNCCGQCTDGSFQGRVRGGTASLIGVSEFTNASTPPKKYRNINFSGSYRNCDFSTISTPPHTDCTPNASAGVNSGKQSYSGSCQYDRVTGVVTNTSAVTNGTAVGTTCVTPADSPIGPNSCVGFAPFLNNIDYTLSQNQTQQQWTYNSGCTLYSAPNFYRQLFGESVNTQLSDEDTDSDAIARLMAGSGATWGAWVPIGGAGCNTTPPACTNAQYQQRTTGFTIAYTEAQWRIVKAGLVPGQGYTFPVELWRALYGTSSYVHLSTISAYGVADGLGNLEIDGDVPNVLGYSTYAAAGGCS